MIQIYNSLTKQKEPFKSIEPKKVSLYVCGVTVYDYCHIGHARTYCTFDVVIRFLRSQGYDVTYVRNITDIDDKIIKRANENAETTQNLVSRFIEVMNDEFAKLNIEKPTFEPTATGSIDEIILLINTLIEKDFAYPADNGDVYYRVRKFKGYGKLSGQKLDQLEAGSRVDVDDNKEDPLDFVLWKASKEGEPAWPSPWGEGRPGWHIECSAMSKKCFGGNFDIHAGGSDLRFPHHENEIAQSEAANGCAYANYWMHSGMVQVNDEKMSKSLGNFFVIGDVLKQYPAEVVRYFLIAGHYRSEINYSEANLESARQALTRLYTALRGVTLAPKFKPSAYTEQFNEAMSDDFNTPKALALLFDMARQINKLKKDSPELASTLSSELVALGHILGILNSTPEAFLQSDDTDATWVENKIKERNEARTARDFAKADAIRNELLAKNIHLEDASEGTIWRFISG